MAYGCGGSSPPSAPSKKVIYVSWFHAIMSCRIFGCRSQAVRNGLNQYDMYHGRGNTLRKDRPLINVLSPAHLS